MSQDVPRAGRDNKSIKDNRNKEINILKDLSKNIGEKANYNNGITGRSGGEMAEQLDNFYRLTQQQNRPTESSQHPTSENVSNLSTDQVIIIAPSQRPSSVEISLDSSRNTASSSFTDRSTIIETKSENRPMDPFSREIAIQIVIAVRENQIKILMTLRPLSKRRDDLKRTRPHTTPDDRIIWLRIRGSRRGRRGKLRKRDFSRASLASILELFRDQSFSYKSNKSKKRNKRRTI